MPTIGERKADDRQEEVDSRALLGETADHFEDWFVLARDGRSAARYHEHYEGYDPGEATAAQVVRVLVLDERDTVPRHAWLPDLKNLGFKVLQARSLRVVRLGPKTYREGNFREIAEAMYAAIDRERRKNLAKRAAEQQRIHLVRKF